MADNQTQPTNNPWEQNWGSGQSYLNVAQEQAQPSREPWNENWGSGTSYLTPAAQKSYNPTAAPSVDPIFDDVVNKMIRAESGGRHRTASGGLTTSPVGAQGITQVMPATGRDPGFDIRPLEDDSEEEYIRFGRDYLSTMLSRYGGDYEKALAAYNAGPGSVDKAVQRGGAEWKQFLPKKSETIPYINKIMRGLNAS